MRSNDLPTGVVLTRMAMLVAILLPGTVAGQELEESAAADPPAVVASSPPAAVLWRMNDRSEIDMANLVAELAGSDSLFLGEIHDNDAGHAFQLEVVSALVEAGRNVCISFEMFERDVQGAVDDYLAGRIDREHFLAVSRPWKNYGEHYGPILELARERRLPVLAANLPASVARSVASGDASIAEHAAWQARETTAPEDAYWRRFGAAMAGHGGNSGEETLRRFYASQCLKDDTMAESIADWMDVNGHRPSIVVHLCGHFHSDYGLGTVARLQARRPLARISVVTMEAVTEDGKLDLDKHRDRAHYLLAVPGNTPRPAASQDSAGL